MINSFKKEYAFLSNFYLLDHPIYDDMGVPYSSVEHFFQAQKSDDEVIRRRIASCKRASDAKNCGRSLILASDWDSKKDGVMWYALNMKFKNNPKLAARLKDTGQKVLTEGNYWHDNYWGVCFCDKCFDNEVGVNRLGEMLMKVRECL